MGDIGKKNHSIDLEESRTGYKHDFPEDLPPRNEPPLAQGRWRNRRFWIPSVSSFSIVHTPDGQARIRHIVMITILFLRAAMSGLSIFAAIIHNNVGAIVAYSLLALLSVWFTATCLGIIGDAAGDRDVKSVIIKRWHFDAFLGFCLIIHALLILLFFFGLGGLGLELTGVGMWFLILGVAWIAGWQPEFRAPSYQRSWVA